ncbi:hypothetical protein [Sphingomonas sp. SRS2]|uniref:hypothetical protein n=1 Tax=Sphingomonas sp. SRS2 TaxID=133190 RepID=UPI000695E2AF|nr:hypothetical protein [Sphingomonas sp. SRS2]
MSNAKRARGRPKGSGKDDRPVLLRLAELLVAKPRMRPTTALKKIIYRPEASYVRRIQAKWKAIGAELLAEVRARHTPVVHGSRPSATALARRVAGSSVLSSMEAMHNHPTLRAIRDLQNSPTLKAVRELQNSPALKAIRELQESPTLKAIRELQTNPTLRIMREIHDSPAMKIMREMEDMRRRFGF